MVGLMNVRERVGSAAASVGVLKVPVNDPAPKTGRVEPLPLQDQRRGDTPVATLAVADDLPFAVTGQFLDARTELVKRDVERSLNVIELSLAVGPDVEKENPFAPGQAFLRFRWRVLADIPRPEKPEDVQQEHNADEGKEETLGHGVPPSTGYWDVRQERIPPSRFSALKPISRRSAVAFKLLRPLRQ